MAYRVILHESVRHSTVSSCMDHIEGSKRRKKVQIEDINADEDIRREMAEHVARYVPD